MLQSTGAHRTPSRLKFLVIYCHPGDGGVIDELRCKLAVRTPRKRISPLLPVRAPSQNPFALAGPPQPPGILC